MPYTWTSMDTRNAVLASLIPAGVAVVGSGFIGSQRNLQVFNKTGQTPNWAIRDLRVHTALEYASLAPVGYASYLVYKFGGGFDYSDTTVALALYGVNMVTALATNTAFKTQNLKWVTVNSVLLHGTALATAVAFYNIDKIASYWMIPYVLWSGYNAALALYIHHKNGKTMGPQ